MPRFFYTPSFLLLGITLLALLIRLFFVASTPYPLNDGGMFVVMVEDLVNNNFALPYYTSYNLSVIPYAYPPLPFYLVALLQSVTAIPIIEFFRILPLIFSVACIPIYYLFTKIFFNNTKYALVATLVFSLLPRSFEALIMGGGLTRSAGFLCSLIAIYTWTSFLKKNHKKYFIITCIFFTASILSHLEMALFSTISLAVLTIFYAKKLKDKTKFIVLLFVTCIACAPWWLTVIIRHGFAPFIAAFSTGGWIGYYLNPFFLFTFTEEPLLPLLAFFGLIGMITELRKQKLFLTLWFLLLVFFNPRGAINVSIVPFSCFAAIGVLQILYPTLFLHTHTKLQRPIRPKANTVLIIFFILYQVASLLFLYRLEKISLFSFSRNDYDAMQWVTKHTDSEDVFFIVTLHARDWGKDKVTEWFPAITKRESVNTLQGTEWLPNHAFTNLTTTNHILAPCITQSITCIDTWAIKAGKKYDYLYISKETYIHERSEQDPAEIVLTHVLRTSQIFQKVYENPDVEIWKKTP